MNDDQLQMCYATDMTTALGAAAYPQAYQLGGVLHLDPDAEKYFIDLIDLLMNTDTVGLTLPRGTQSAPVLLDRLHMLFKEIPNAATVVLSEDTENKIVEGFRAILLDPLARERLQRWIAFQLLNDIVKAGHAARVGKIISEDGRDAWDRNHLHILTAVPVDFRKTLLPVAAEYRSQIAAFNEKVADQLLQFVLCYAFDVYRRGWKYLADIGDTAIYIPHQLRDNALEAGTERWRESKQRPTLWVSWGGYLAMLIKSRDPADTLFQTPEALADCILEIRETIDAMKLPRWQQIDPENTSRATLDEMHEQLRATLRALKRTPPLKLPDKHVNEVLGAGGSALHEILEYVAPATKPILGMFRIAFWSFKRLNPDLARDAGMRFEVKKRNIINDLCKGVIGCKEPYGFRGLIRGSDV